MNPRPQDPPLLDRVRRPIAEIRLLVVEDDTNLREQIVKVLVEWGFHTASVWSGEDALRLNACHAYDIAVLDFCLPGVDGIETLYRLRQHAPHLQGIVLTGSATIAAAKRAIHLDVVEFLTKPCHRGELEQAIDRARRRLPATLPSLDPPCRELPTQSTIKLEDVERQHIMAALQRHQGDRKSTAAELGVTRKTLYNRIKQYAAQGFRTDCSSGRGAIDSRE
jgi:DNA-binding NtrC family response regulator